MPDSLYLATNQNATGKRMVALGLMELAVSRFERVVFFRPVVRDHAMTDQSVRLMRQRYHLKHSPYEMVGLTRSEVRRLLADDRYDELLQQIQQKFKSLQQDADFAVVEGTSFQGLVPEIEFELNADIAANLGCAILSVYSARGKSPQDVAQSIRIGNDSLADHGSKLFATVINQVSNSDLGEVLQTTREATGPDLPIYVMPEEPLLRQPTLREIQVGLGATVFAGDDAALDREVARLKVAAMTLPSFLQRLSQSSLVITPGDRSDILIACTLATRTPGGPSPAGIVLTGGLQPAESIARYAKQAVGLPILMTNEDTFTTANQVSEIRAEIGVHSPKKVESAIGLFQRHIDCDDLATRLKAPSASNVTPLLFEYALIQQARQQRTSIVLPEGEEPRILQAIDVLLRRDVADIVLLGDPERIHARAGQVGVTLPDYGVQIIDPQTSDLHEKFAQEYFQLRVHKGMTIDVARDRMHEPSYFATMMIRRGVVGGMVSGAINTTANTIRPAFEFIKTRPGVSCVSSVFLMCLKNAVLVYGDCAVIPNPTADQLVEIASSSADTARQFGIEPRVALLSYSTGTSGQGDDVQKVRQATEKLRKRRPDLPIEGPMQYDAAVDPKVAQTKLPGSPVAGRATVLIFPDLNTGNNTYKAVQRSAGAVAIGPVLQGLRKPVNDLSRGCTVTDIVNTVAITAIQAQETGLQPLNDGLATANGIATS